MPTILHDEKGAALITALMLTALSLVIATALIYSVLMETQVSAVHKRYRSVLAATQGGAEALAQEIIPYLMKTSDAVTLVGADLQREFLEISLNLGSGSTDACLTQKLNVATAEQSDLCRSTNSDARSRPDLVFTLKGPDTSGFTIYTKIVDTVPGNSDRHAVNMLDAGTSVAGNEEGVRPLHVPALFSISVYGERQDSGRERARLSLLYSY